MAGFGRLLITLGILLIIAGGIMVYAPNIPWLGKLPGDISIKKESFSFYFPITTCILISIILSLISWFFRR